MDLVNRKSRFSIWLRVSLHAVRRRRLITAGHQDEQTVLISCAIVLCLCFVSLWLDPAGAARLRIRKELLAKQSDQALINVTGHFEHIQEITEKKDCKFQVSLRANEINVAVVGAFINACSRNLIRTRSRG
ncbi:MAG: hypothetical protein C4293_07825 [Nitrospiraceae bacterium]